MSKLTCGCATTLSLPPPPSLPLVLLPSNHATIITSCSSCTDEGGRQLHVRSGRVLHTRCFAIRRRVRPSEEDDTSDDEYGHNAEIALLEFYSEAAHREALLVTSVVDGQQVEVLIFKGFSSCLSYGTCPDPTRSILPARAVIKSIDRIKGPFDPSNIEYIEKGLTWETFKTRLLRPR